MFVEWVRTGANAEFQDLFLILMKTRAVHVGRSTNMLTGLREPRSWEAPAPHPHCHYRISAARLRKETLQLHGEESSSASASSVLISCMCREITLFITIKKSIELWKRIIICP